jgi:hypothetical protein
MIFSENRLPLFRIMRWCSTPKARTGPGLGYIEGGEVNVSRVYRHPEVAAKRPSKDVSQPKSASDFGPLLARSATADLAAVALRGSLCSHLRVTE